jgi:hypothetical protein
MYSRVGTWALPGAIVIVNWELAVLWLLSWTWIANVVVPVVVGVPVIAPVFAVSAKQVGRPPLVILHVYPVPVPPVACRVAEYAVPTVPAGGVVVMVKAALLIVRLNAAEAAWEPLLSVTCRLKLDVPVVVGEPLIVLSGPPLGFAVKVRPLGRLPLAMLQA